MNQLTAVVEQRHVLQCPVEGVRIFERDLGQRTTAMLAEVHDHLAVSIAGELPRDVHADQQLVQCLWT